MKMPTIVKTTKEYMLVKIPLPKGLHFAAGPAGKKERINPTEERLWKIIQEGEREYQKGKTIAARSIDEAISIYERKKKSRAN